MKNPTIRRARRADAETLHRNCYPEARLEDVSDYLAWCLRQAEKGRIVRLVAEVEGQVVGNAQLTAWGQIGEIGSLLVAEGFRRQGLARRLLTAAIAEAKRMGLKAVELEARPDRPEIQAFYQRVGFRPVEAKKEKLSHSSFPRSGVLLRKQL